MNRTPGTPHPNATYPNAIEERNSRAGARDPRAAHHDLGGHPRFICTAVEIEDDAPPDAFGKRVDAIRLALGAAGLMTVDEMRRCIEAIPEEEYHALTYYERWLRAISGLMVEKGVLPASDLSP